MNKYLLILITGILVGIVSPIAVSVFLQIIYGIHTERFYEISDVVESYIKANNGQFPASQDNLTKDGTSSDNLDKEITIRFGSTLDEMKVCSFTHTEYESTITTQRLCDNETKEPIYLILPPDDWGLYEGLIEIKSLELYKLMVELQKE